MIDEAIDIVFTVAVISCLVSVLIYGEYTLYQKYEPARRAADAEKDALYLKHKSDSIRLEIEIHHQLDSLQKLK